MLGILKPTTALRKISHLTKRLRIIQGGTSASKTFSVVAYLIDVAQKNDGLVISITSESFPHLRLGAMRDFMTIMKGNQHWHDDEWSATLYTYTFPSGSIIEFFSVDKAGKAHGPRRDILFINEANNVLYEIYRQLATRTRKVIILDFNPVSSFWVHEKLMPYQRHDFLKLTYKDNEALEPAIVRDIEAQGAIDENYRRVYVLGEIGRNEGQIYTSWTHIAAVPPEARLVRRGLDFGYTNDPTALVDIYEWNGGYILDEQAYQKGMLNSDIAKLIKSQDEQVLVVGDSSEPKSIDEIKGHGIEIIGAVKGADSVNNGVQLMQGQKIYVTERSLNLIKEERNYVWKTDKNGEPLNVPVDLWNHLMDAARYALSDLIVNKPGSFKYKQDREDDDPAPITSGLMNKRF